MICSPSVTFSPVSAQILRKHDLKASWLLVRGSSFRTYVFLQTERTLTFGLTSILNECCIEGHSPRQMERDSPLYVCQVFLLRSCCPEAAWAFEMHLQLDEAGFCHTCSGAGCRPTESLKVHLPLWIDPQTWSKAPYWAHLERYISMVMWIQ